MGSVFFFSLFLSLQGFGIHKFKICHLCHYNEFSHLFRALSNVSKSTLDFLISPDILYKNSSKFEDISGSSFLKRHHKALMVDSLKGKIKNCMYCTNPKRVHFQDKHNICHFHFAILLTGSLLNKRSKFFLESRLHFGKTKHPCLLTLKEPNKIAADDTFFYFYLKKIGLDVSCESFA